MFVRNGFLHTIHQVKKQRYGRAMSAKAEAVGLESSSDEHNRRNFQFITKIKQLMRDVPYPVFTILAQNPATTVPHGLLISSFNTVTLDREPYVSFNLRVPSRTFNAIKASDRFTVHAIKTSVLAKATLDGKVLNPYFIDPVIEEDGFVTLKQNRGALWCMKCMWIKEKSIKIGDHWIMVGKVVNAETERRVEGDVGLLWHQGKYRVAAELSGQQPDSNDQSEEGFK